MTFAVLSVLLVLFFFADILLGSVKIPAQDTLSVLFGRQAETVTANLIFSFRLPKAITALLAGAALSASGLQMQTLFRNPLAGPYILGISSGASLGVSLFLLGIPVLGLTFGSEAIRNIGITGAAWIGSAAILGIIFAAATRVKDILAILILGMMIGSGATAIVSILQYFSPEAALKSFVIWTMGSLGGVSLSQLWMMALFIGIGLLLAVYLIKPLNILLLGEAYAQTMGQNIRAARTVIFISTILLAGTVTAFCGPIAFIGTAVPHIARMIFRNADHRVLMPASMLTGSIIMLACDIISQLPGTGMILPVSAITSLVGIPVVIYVILQNRRIF